MKLTKQQEAEALRVYHLYWDSYTKGDLETFASTLDEDFETIGTSETEVAHNKADGIEIYKAQMTEIVGKVEMRNRMISTKPLNDMVLVNETCDIYVLGEPEWTFYSKIRISTLLHKTASGWKVIQQHGSLPDMRVQEGETLALEKITKENLELRDAVKRRTIELENKSRELEIEAALERVRTVAMGMKKPEDMLDICRIISEQLQQFGVTHIRNIQTAIIDEEKGIYLCYQYFTPYDKEAIERTEYLKSPVEHGMVSQMLASKDGHFTGTLAGKDLEEFREHRKAESHFPDPLLDEAKELSYCFLSIGQGGLGLTLYQPLDAVTQSFFQRFHQVFSLAYQRFRDIEKAQAQAREAQIEAALERVRAETMAMHSSEDVGNCIVKMFAELTALGVDEGTRFGIGILNPNNENNQLWTARKDGDEVNMHIGNLDMSRHPLLKSAREAWKAQIPLHKYVLEGEDLLDYYRMLNNAPDYKIQIPIEKLPKKEIQHCFIFEHGFFYAFTPKEFQPELIHITKRFSSQFAQTYRRYLDLVKAEAQAREAEIELALERVRAKTMAMHHTEELKEVIQVVFDQFVSLKVHVEHAGFILDYKDREDMHIWLADHQQGVPTEITFPYFDSPHWNSYLEAKAKQESFFANLLTFEVKNKFYQDLFGLIPELTEEAQQAIFGKPGLAISTVLLDNVGLYIEHYSETPFSAEENKILMRFGKVFQQTYTRFLDLQKAEAQAREAQIEAALERVRSRSMAMHKSEELREVVFELFSQMFPLGLAKWGFGIWLIDDTESNYLVYFSTPTDPVLPEPYEVSDMKFHLVKKITRAYKEQSSQCIIEYRDNEKRLFDDWCFEKTGMSRFPESVKQSIYEVPYVQFSFCPMKYGLLQAIDVESFPEKHISILQRFTKVFEQTYTRFLDLQKAEAQAREAQIEAALERVRSRSLAMHKTAELQTVIHTVHQELLNLNISISGGSFIVINSEIDNEIQCWGSGGTADTSDKVRIPRFEKPFYTHLLNGIKSGQGFFTEEYTRDEKIEFFSFLFQQQPWSKLGEKEKKETLSAPGGYTRSCAVSRHTSIFIINHFGEKFSESENAILKRFGKVFEQSYTRFLDLQKAEAQAREAQIQLALERVRARTMAMQKSDELAEVSFLLNKQVVDLGIPTRGCAFNIYNEHDSTEWFSNMEGTLPPYQTPRENIFLKYYEAGQRGETLLIEEFGKERIKQHYDYLHSLHLLGDDEEVVEKIRNAMPDFQIDHVAFFKFGYLLFITLVPAPEAHDVFKRFAKEFEQTYTRFLDLQKAEAQAREAKIEAALEKVRSRTMGMQSSEELPEVANLLFLEVQALGIPAWSCGHNVLAADKKSATAWMSSKGTLQTPFTLRLWGEASFDEMGEFVVSNDVFLEQELGGKALIEHYNHMKSFPDLKPTFDQIEALGLSLPTFQINHLCKFSHGFLLFITYEPVPDAHDIFKRFTKVFDQTYTRFLDLQKAEAQAREAKIEVALEKVRSRTMGMQKSDELADVANVLFQEMNELVHNLWTCGFVLCEKDRAEDEWWLSLEDGFTRGFFLPNVNDYAHAHLYEGWLKKDDFRTAQLEGDKLQDHYDWLMQIPIGRSIFDEMEAAGMQRPEWQKLHAAYFSKGYLVIITREPCAEEAIFKRFAQVFDLTYTRFLDLKKAEAQAREAQIENALEKVRSRSLAMQSPDELIEVAQLLREEMGALGVEELETSSIYIHDDNSDSTQCWFTIKNSENPGKSVTDQMTLELQDTWVGRKMLDFYRSPSNQTSILMQGEQRIEWIRYCEKKSELFGTSNFYGDTVPDRTYHLYKFSNGYIGAAAPGEISSESWELLKRATAVFSFAYTRFRDLQMAEANAQSALRQASLDRVRAEISSMRHTDDLDRITPLFFHELTKLGVPFIRCGVFIIQEKQELVEAYLSSPEGNSLGVLRLPYHASELTYQTVEAWRKGVVYRQHWNKDDFVQWINQLMEQDQIQDSGTYQGTAAPPESLDLHFVPFAQGMLYVGAENPLDEKELELVQALAKAFSIAYARYEDFVKLEQAKSEVESAMSELKSTQSQLVQQEKLASLGQLTAGIAHEIKNPLNFVNNFSEVSIELVDEAIEERNKDPEARDETLVDEILIDIKSNLQKVHEHGSRANGIVTSMLQHSRGGSGKMAPTDLNALIKEYVNLSFHGMRANKNPIDVELSFDLDPKIKEVPLIKEDFIRVIINLCNNAFDAMRGKTYEVQSTKYEVEAGNDLDYLPKLKVTTSLEKGQIRIAIQDNGPGIPDEIKDKILQPFFTTKKGTEGTGLGLSITHDIVKAHGGELKVESAVREGTLFSIQLPHLIVNQS